ncbi:MAG: hypothetical protein ACQERN_00860 [Thermodesulfobacteriota bacterium]
MFLHLSIVPALAADEPGWRPIYDTIMLWVNFAILVYLLYRFLRQPLKTFLQGQRDEVAQEIAEVEEKKQQMQDMIAETKRQIEESAVRFDKIKARIIDEGETTKQQMIEDAKKQGKKLMEMEKKKADSQILRARKTFLAEMVDAATQYAQDRLPGELTEDDHDKMIDLYLDNVDRMAG